MGKEKDPLVGTEITLTPEELAVFVENRAKNEKLDAEADKFNAKARKLQEKYNSEKKSLEEAMKVTWTALEEKYGLSEYRLRTDITTGAVLVQGKKGDNPTSTLFGDVLKRKPRGGLKGLLDRITGKAAKRERLAFLMEGMSGGA